jgi:hypothetical protein
VQTEIYIYASILTPIYIYYQIKFGQSTVLIPDEEILHRHLFTKHPFNNIVKKTGCVLEADQNLQTEGKILACTALETSPNLLTLYY